MTLSDNGSLAVTTWHGSEPGALFVHATGFTKELWRPVIDAMGAAGEPVAGVAFDQRGHGDSPPLAIPMDWSEIGGDVEQVAASIDPRPLIGVGHSSGGAAIAITAIVHSEAFHHLVLIEPIITPPPFERHESDPMAAVAEGRRSSFRDRATALAHFRSTGAFAGWVDGAIDAYVESGLRDANGEVVLKCAPATEAEHYRSGWAHSTWDRLGDITCPVSLVVGAESTTHRGHYLDELTARFPEVELTVVPNTSHFVPMERPDVVAAAINQARNRG